jgi:hypothetical protein
MPASLTEIYGSPNNEQVFQFSSTTATQIDFCVNIIALSTNPSAYLSVYYGPAGTGLQTNELSTTTRIPIGSGSLTGLQCSGVGVAVPNGELGVTIKGNNGGGIGDMPAFGAISLAWYQMFPAITFTVPVGYHVQIITLTGVSFKLKIQFDATLNLANTVTFNWKSIGS